MTNPFKTQRSISEVIGPDRAAVVPSGSTAPERQQSTGRHSEDVPPYTKTETLEAGLTAIEQAGRCSVHEGTHLQQAGCQNWVLMSAIQLTPHSASDKAALVKAERAADKQKQELEKLAGIQSLDWKAIPPPMLAQILINIPFRGATGEPDYYLQPWQAMIFALRSFELNLSPFSNEVWFNPKNNKVNVSFEGKLKLARMNGLNLSPPMFERIPADPKQPLVAYKCTITSPSGPCEYTATLKEWAVAKSPVWREKPEHMLQLRAAEKCLSFATGSGSSELMGEQDLQVGTEAEKFIPSFTQEK